MRRFPSGVGCLIFTTIVSGLLVLNTFVPTTRMGYTQCVKNIVTATGAVPDGTKEDTGSAALRYGWRPIFRDEFDGSCLSSAWKVYDSMDLYGVAIRRPQAVSLVRGELRITSRGDVTGGLALNDDRIFGRWEVRARFERGTGYSQVLLLWPQSQNWPQDGEIDFSEVPNGDRLENSLTVHYGINNNQVGTKVRGDFSQWHDYAVEWERDHVTMYVDGKPVFTTMDAAAIPRTPMHLCIQQDVGPIPGWLPPPNMRTPSAVTMHVAWVKAYA